MQKKLALILGAAAVFAMAACSNSLNGSIPATSSLAQPQSNVTQSCGDVAEGYARCFSLVRTDVGGGDPNGYHGIYRGVSIEPLSVNPDRRPTPPPGPTPTPVQSPTPTPAPGNPSGYAPADLQAAYALPSSANGAGQTVAIVDAYDAVTAESDLGVYRAQFGLPPCTTANGCFKKVNQTGGSTPPAANASWGQEISLDLDMVSAICPNCHILLVEANSASFVDLGTSVNTAASLGANAISNSYGGSEVSNEMTYDAYYNHPGHAVTVSSGDSGYGVEYPAASPYVTAVGGTSLSRASNARGWSETVWSGAGSGCSALEAKPSWQTDTGCTRRTVADVSAVANPNTGVAVYDSTAYRGQSGWMVFGGTSVASPVIASVYALAGNAGSVNYGSFSYANLGALFDVTSGSNGSCGTYLCTGRAGYDGPTGNGTPNGIGAF
ncbi:MAG TPA: S53 family peptidase [Candidatus Rubrimentiphilum sp.]|nr:S53 family peptidase [Candidatus Rubrimentiphilum sp.]